MTHIKKFKISHFTHYIKIAYIILCNFLLFNCRSANQLNHETAKGILKTYNAPETILHAPELRVTANGKNVFIYDLLIKRNYNKAITTPTVFGSFDFKGHASLNVTYNKDIKTAVVKPLKLGIVPGIKGNTISFLISKNGNYQIEITYSDGSESRPVALFANTIEKFKLKKSDTNTVFFASGKLYETGKIDLKSNQTLIIEPGAVVKGYLSLINVHNVTIRGGGILYSTDPVSGFLEGPIWIKDAVNIKINDLIIVNREDKWTLHAATSNNINIKSVKVLSEIRDGIDFDGSQNVHVSNCYVQAHDDALCLKATNYADPFVSGGNQQVKNIFIKNCVFSNVGGGNCIEIGHETWCPSFKNIKFKNIEILHSLPNDSLPTTEIWPEAALSIHLSDHALVKNVSYKNINIEDLKDDYAIDLYIFANPLLPRITSDRGKIQSIYFKNISVNNSRPSRIKGYDNMHVINGVTIKHLKQNGILIRSASEGKFELKEYKNIKFRP